MELGSAARDHLEEHPALGSGAGTLERFWRERPTQPSACATRTVSTSRRSRSSGRSASGSSSRRSSFPSSQPCSPDGRCSSRRRWRYGAFLVHAGVDWDWELRACDARGPRLGVCSSSRRATASRGSSRPRSGSWWGWSSGSRASQRSSAASATARSRAPSARREREFADAHHDADRASQLMPWSGRPWIARGEAELAAGRLGGRRRASFRTVESSRTRPTWKAPGHSTSPDRSRTRRRARAALRMGADALYPRSTEIGRASRSSRRNPPERHDARRPRRMRDPVAVAQRDPARSTDTSPTGIGDGPTLRTHERRVERRRAVSVVVRPTEGEPSAWVVGIARAASTTISGRGTRLGGPARRRPRWPRATWRSDVLRQAHGDGRRGGSTTASSRPPLLRYGADLSAREIGRLLEMRANAVDVALHRTRERLRGDLAHLDEATGTHAAGARRPARAGDDLLGQALGRIPSVGPARTWTSSRCQVPHLRVH